MRLHLFVAVEEFVDSINQNGFVASRNSVGVFGGSVDSKMILSAVGTCGMLPKVSAHLLSLGGSEDAIVPETRLSARRSSRRAR